VARSQSAGSSAMRPGFAIFFLVAVLVGGAAYWLWSGAQAGSPEQREAAARDLIDGINDSVTAADSSLAATKAIADFGLDKGIRLVLVRILDEVRLELRIETARDVILAGPPRICLVGPAWAPDDAGLSDRCWGEPDLAAVVDARMPPDAAGHVALDAGQPLVIDATVRRGDERCDYRPGTWQLEVSVVPLIDDSAVGSFELPAAALEVPLEPDGAALPFVGILDSRCRSSPTAQRFRS